MIAAAFIIGGFILLAASSFTSTSDDSLGMFLAGLITIGIAALTHIFDIM